MTTQYIWSITSLNAIPQIDQKLNVVSQVNWECQAIDDRICAVTLGSVAVTYQAGAPFTTYEQLTQDQAWAWVNPHIDRQKVETELRAMIDAQKSPEFVTPPIPWSN